MEKFSWVSLREKIAKIHPDFASIIDELSPPDDHFLYLVRYPYGALILDKGSFQLPNNSNKLVSIYDSTIPNEIRNDLDYNGTMPVGLVSQKTIESFIIFRDRILPSTLFSVGDMIALWRVLDEGLSYQEGTYWNVSSGSRTICMLSKITDKKNFQSLKSKYNLKLPIPRYLRDHWSVFSHLALHNDFSQSWASEIIFFSKKWFEHKKDKVWNAFYNFLLNMVWQSSAFIRNQLILNFIFSVAQENKNLKPSPYLVDTVKHLLAIGIGTVPGFVTGIDDTSAPISGLQKVFLEDYGLKKYAPVIIHSQHYSFQSTRPVYYSLQLPTTMSFSPKSNRASSAMAELRELKHVMEVLISEILKGHLEVNRTPLFQIAQNVRYSFHHTEADKSNEITLATNLLELDPSLSTICSSQTLAFPEFSPFFWGCVAISSAL